MSRTGWKQFERDAAKWFDAKRYWANAGERVDADSPYFAVQCKNPHTLSLATLSDLVDEMTIQGIDDGKIPVVCVKLSARRPTPPLVVLPADAWALVWGVFGLAEAVKRLSAVDLRRCVQHALRESPGMRKRVAKFVEKSTQRSRRRFARAG